MACVLHNMLHSEMMSDVGEGHGWDFIMGRRRSWDTPLAGEVFLPAFGHRPQGGKRLSVAGSCGSYRVAAAMRGLHAVRRQAGVGTCTVPAAFLHCEDGTCFV